MKKTYWRIISLISICVIFMFGSYVSTCDYKVAKCFWGDSILVTRTFFHIALAATVVSPFLFFFNDKFFTRWFRFALIWFFLAIVFVALTPEQHNFMSLNPDKETVSIWMSTLFVIVSLVMFIKERFSSKN